MADIEKRLKTVDESKERQLDNLLQGVANLEEGHEGLKKDVDQLKDGLSDVKLL